MKLRSFSVAAACLLVATLTQAQVLGGLQAVHEDHPEVAAALANVSTLVGQLQTVIVDRTSRTDLLDLAPLRSIGALLKQVSNAVAGTPADDADADADTAAGEAGATAGAAPRAAAMRGEIQSRQDALATLDRVVRFLEQTEPGNPAPLLIQRAKRLIGVSFYDIIADLAPNAMDTIETVTGARPESE